jgi:heterodisulfide reductase subunit D
MSEKQSDTLTNEMVKVDVNELTKGLYYCLHCSLCKTVLASELKSLKFHEICPPGAKYKFDGYFGSGRAGAYRAFLTGEFGFEDSPRLPEVLYKCQNCGACSIICRFGSTVGACDLERVSEVVRGRCVEEGYMLLEHSAMIDALKAEDNVFGEPKADRGKWAEGLGLKDINKEEVEVILHAGCRFSYDEDLRPAIKSVARILSSSGIDVGIAGKEEACCGGRAFEVGYQGESLKFAEDMASRVKASGASILVTACSDCYYTFKKLYPLIDRELDVEILHMTEYIKRLIEEQRIVFTEKVPLKLTYHDPCRLGRKMFPDFGYDAPRAILSEIPGTQLIEMERTKDCAWCCGAGAGVLEAYPELNDFTANERILEAISTGAEALVTACPWCERNFKDAIERIGIEMKVYDVAELVSLAMGGE